MKRKNKYRKGDKISSIDELVKQDFVYWNDRITNKGWFLSWQIRMTITAIRSGIIRYAVPNVDSENESVLNLTNPVLKCKATHR